MRVNSEQRRFCLVGIKFLWVWPHDADKTQILHHYSHPSLNFLSSTKQDLKRTTTSFESVSGKAWQSLAKPVLTQKQRNERFDTPTYDLRMHDERLLHNGEFRLVAINVRPGTDHPLKNFKQKRTSSSLAPWAFFNHIWVVSPYFPLKPR